MRRSVFAIGLVLGACGGAPSAPSSTPANQSGYPVAASRIGDSAQFELRNVLKQL